MTSTSFEGLKKAHLARELAGLSDAALETLLRNYPGCPLVESNKVRNLFHQAEHNYNLNRVIPLRIHICRYIKSLLSLHGVCSSDYPFCSDTFTPKEFSLETRIEFISRFYTLSFQRLKHPLRIEALKLIFPRYNELINSTIYRTEIEPAILQLKGWRDDGVNTPERKTVVELLKKFYGATSVTTRGNWVAQQLAKINTQ